jgi:hypothetical protein
VFRCWGRSSNKAIGEAEARRALEGDSWLGWVREDGIDVGKIKAQESVRKWTLK